MPNETKEQTRLTRMTFFVGDVEFKLNIDPAGKSGSVVTKGLHEGLESPDVERYNAAADALESMVLACACEGINVLAPSFQKALASALNAIGNNLM